MNKNPKIDRFPFFAETFIVDKNGRVRPTTLCNQMLTSGGRHGEARGFGATSTLGWVLARLALHIDRLPEWGERYFIETWVKNLYHGFTDRCIRVVDEENNTIASMLATFALMNLKTRTSVDLNGDIGLRLTECILPDEPFTISRIPAINRTKIENVTFCRKPQYSDIDINGHMNSIRMLDHIIDALPIDFINSHNLTDFIVSYMHEGEAEETLAYGITEIEKNHFLAQINKENGITASRCELLFTPLYIKK